jgi:hypothetical protein
MLDQENLLFGSYLMLGNRRIRRKDLFASLRHLAAVPGFVT